MMQSEESDDGVKMPVGSGVLADTTPMLNILDESEQIVRKLSEQLTAGLAQDARESAQALARLQIPVEIQCGQRDGGVTSGSAAATAAAALKSQATNPFVSAGASQITSESKKKWVNSVTMGHDNLISKLEKKGSGSAVGRIEEGSGSIESSSGVVVEDVNERIMEEQRPHHRVIPDSQENLPADVAGISLADVFKQQAESQTSSGSKQPPKRVFYPANMFVQYFSRSSQNWIPARVQGVNEVYGCYVLDVQPIAPYDVVRPLPAGTFVEYESSTLKTWAPAQVLGYDEAIQCYQLDIQPMAPAARVRLRIAQSEPSQQPPPPQPQQQQQSSQPSGEKSSGGGYYASPQVDYQKVSEIPMNVMQEDYFRGSDKPLAPSPPPAPANFQRVQSQRSQEEEENFVRANPNETGSNADKPIFSSSPSPAPPKSSVPMVKCFLCHTEKAITALCSLPCGHAACAVCLKDDFVKQTDGRFVDQVVQCSECGMPLLAVLVEEIVGSDAYQREKSRIDEEFAKKLQLEEDDHIEQNPFSPSPSAPKDLSKAGAAGSKGLPGSPGMSPTRDTSTSISPPPRPKPAASPSTYQSNSSKVSPKAKPKSPAVPPPQDDDDIMKKYNNLSQTMAGTGTAFGQFRVDHEAEDEALARKLQAEEERGGSVQREATGSKFDCPLCLERFPMDDKIELDCGHGMCRDCFKAYLDNKIKEGQVREDELCCVVPGCGRPITVDQIRGNATPELFERYLDFSARLWQPDDNEDELMVDCVTPDCERLLVPSNVEVIECPRCHVRFCPLCRANPPHEGVSCEDHARWLAENSQGDDAFEELMKKENWVRCPVCTAGCERSDGCNFLSCWSPSCRKKTFFCYVCGKQLRKDQHYSHYPKGPYQLFCETYPDGPPGRESEAEAAYQKRMREKAEEKARAKARSPGKAVASPKAAAPAPVSAAKRGQDKSPVGAENVRGVKGALPKLGINDLGKVDLPSPPKMANPPLRGPPRRSDKKPSSRGRSSTGGHVERVLIAKVAPGRKRNNNAAETQGGGASASKTNSNNPFAQAVGSAFGQIFGAGKAPSPSASASGSPPRPPMSPSASPSASASKQREKPTPKRVPAASSGYNRAKAAGKGGLAMDQESVQGGKGAYDILGGLMREAGSRFGHVLGNNSKGGKKQR